MTTEWVKKQLRSQRSSCYVCEEPLDEDWSVDRISNDLPHIKDNCMVSCRHCQHASAHRPTCGTRPAFKPETLAQEKVDTLADAFGIIVPAAKRLAPVSSAFDDVYE